MKPRFMRRLVAVTVDCFVPPFTNRHSTIKTAVDFVDPMTNKKMQFLQTRQPSIQFSSHRANVIVLHNAIELGSSEL